VPTGTDTPPPVATEMDGGAMPEPTTSSPPVVADGPPNPSGWPEPGEGGVAQPAGTPGELEVLDWAGFKGAVSYTFDDSNSSQVSNFQQIMDLEVPFTFYMQTGKGDAGNAVWGEALAAGHEIGNHTKSHQGSGANLAGDTDEATTYIQNTWDTTPYTMAAPNGSQDYVSVAQTRFLINRGVAGAQIAPGGNDNAFNLGSYVTGNSNAVSWGVSDFNTKVDAARSGGTWHILTMHGFAGGNDGAYGPVNLSDFLDAVAYAKSFGDVWIGTVADVGAYWAGQKAVTSAMAADTADGKTWTWTLPDNFPPGRYLRVLVGGGTLTQDGEALPWNEHGFYEVALDTGSVTLAP
jgi:peptidoglycan/xylan/chitin deacetylase (PgdA/CDA1 family)